MEAKRMYKMILVMHNDEMMKVLKVLRENPALHGKFYGLTKVDGYHTGTTAYNISLLRVAEYAKLIGQFLPACKIDVAEEGESFRMILI